MHPSWLRGDHAPHGMEIELPACRGVSSLCRIAGLFDPRENKGESSVSDHRASTRRSFMRTVAVAGFLVREVHPQLGDVVHPGAAARFEEAIPLRPAPGVGEHTDEILAELERHPSER